MSDETREATTRAPEEITRSPDAAYATLSERFPAAVTADSREGYGGIIFDAAQLPQVAMAIRDELGYDYLSSATAVDYHGQEDECLEMVYHAYRTTGGPALVFKARTERADAEIPSLIDVWPGVDFQEARSLGSVWNTFSRPPQFEAHPAMGRIRRPSHAQGLARALLRRGP